MIYTCAPSTIPLEQKNKKIQETPLTAQHSPQSPFVSSNSYISHNPALLSYHKPERNFAAIFLSMHSNYGNSSKLPNTSSACSNPRPLGQKHRDETTSDDCGSIGSIISLHDSARMQLEQGEDRLRWNNGLILAISERAAARCGPSSLPPSHNNTTSSATVDPHFYQERRCQIKEHRARAVTFLGVHGRALTEQVNFEKLLFNPYPPGKVKGGIG